MKRSRTTSLVVMGLTPLFMSACGDDAQKSQQEFSTVDACAQAGVPSTSCQEAYEKAVGDASVSAPTFGSRDQCGAQYDEDSCQPQMGTGGNEVWSPAINGFLIARVIRGGHTTYFPAGPVYLKRDNTNYSPRYGGVYASSGSAGWRSVPSEEVAGEGDTASRGGFGGGEEGGRS
jgi:uncharacterized protein YgiB involved in biofilm formation